MPQGLVSFGVGILPTWLRLCAVSSIICICLRDVYSRKIVGYEVYEAESGDYAAELLQRSLLREKSPPASGAALR